MSLSPIQDLVLAQFTANVNNLAKTLKFNTTIQLVSDLSELCAQDLLNNLYEKNYLLYELSNRIVAIEYVMEKYLCQKTQKLTCEQYLLASKIIERQIKLLEMQNPIDYNQLKKAKKLLKKILCHLR